MATVAAVAAAMGALWRDEPVLGRRSAVLGGQSIGGRLRGWLGGGGGSALQIDARRAAQ